MDVKVPIIGKYVFRTFRQVLSDDGKRRKDQS